MDIDLLSKMVHELILEHDEVELPGVGTFIAELIPATFTDRGYTINPPYRRLYFRNKESGSDILAQFYAANNKISLVEAKRILGDFLTEMASILRQKKVIIFPGLGKLRATKENNFFFVEDDDLDIFPDGFGLQPISLKTHRDTPAQQTPAEPESDKLEESSRTAVTEEAPATQEAPVGTPAVRERKSHPALTVFIVILVLAILFFAFLYFGGRYFPEIVDKLLYNSDELYILYK